MTMPVPPSGNDPLYARARQLLLQQPDMGKAKLAAALGVKTPTSRRLRERFRGETQGHNLGNPDYCRVMELKQQHPDWGAMKIAAATGITIDHAKVHLARWIGAQSFQKYEVPPTLSTTEAPADGSQLQVAGGADDKSLSYRGSRITTMEDLIVFCQVDRKIWDVEKFIVNKWEVGARDPGTGTILTEPLFQLKVWLRRKVAEQRLEQIMQRMLEAFQKAAPPREPITRTAAGKGMLELSLMDLHLGKYCWDQETGRSYTIEIMERMFWAALEDLLAKSAGCALEKILFVVGNDFFNVDNLNRTTTAGTPQDECGRWQETFIRGRELMVAAIDRLRKIALVHVLIVPGNHDTQRLWYLGTTLSAYFHRTPDVLVDHDSKPRKYIKYGRNLIGFCHGNTEKHPNLPMLMAHERPQDWAVTKCREWHVGHFHSKKTKVFVAHEDCTSVQVKILPSLCPPDAWHASMGYSSKLAAEAYYWDPEEGCVATFTHAPS